MLKAFFIIASFFLSSMVAEEFSLDSKIEVDDFVTKLQSRHQIPGVALAIIKDGEVIYKKNYGVASIEHNVPLSKESIFRIYSLTKPVVATGVFKLLEEKKLTLEDEVSKYVTGLPDSWKDVQIKHLLTQSSGLPDIKDYEELEEKEAQDRVFSDPIRYAKGEKYQYNQSNFWLIQKIIESTTNKKLEDYIIQEQFSFSKKTSKALFSTDSSDVILNRVTAYFPYPKNKMQIDTTSRNRYLTAANGLNLTLDNFIDWDNQFYGNLIINEQSKKRMWQRFPYIKSNKIFTYGWNERRLNGHVSYGFSGSMITAYRVFPDDKFSIIFLSNGFEHWFNIERVVNHIAGIVNKEIFSLENSIYLTLLDYSLNNSIEDVGIKVIELKNDTRLEKFDLEGQINNVGYSLMNNFKNLDKALEVFLLNKNNYPDSWNVHDSLAEAYEADENYSKSIESYQKALVLNQSNNKYVEILKAKIEQLRKNIGESNE